ncbi:MAG TPA: hypothetical protein VGX68_28460 [Thermoanaerobaculia bacterium]|jgi:pterin-4a-carbinolamine dehydratase|nr:hypothetical protein [Thermoanaerobaculia bacterium]
MNAKQTMGFETLDAKATRQRPPGVEQKLKAERVQEELKAMPGWRLLPNGSSLHRSRQFYLPGEAARYAAFAGELAASQHQRIELYLSGTRVTVVVFGPKGIGGITKNVLGFARQLG